MSGLSTRLPSKNTTIWSTSLTPQSTRRSPHCRVNSTCRRTPKARRIWHNANYSDTRAPDKRTVLPIYYSSPLRYCHNRLNLPPTNRPKIPNCLLLCQPHRPSDRGYSYSNPLRLHRSIDPNNRPRTNILSPILLSQY